MTRHVDHRDLDLAAAIDAKRAGGLTASLCLPARNEAATIATIVAGVVDHPLLDEVVVVDDHSTDGTGDAASAAGATVVDAAAVLTEHARGPGKGQALWKAVACSAGDLVAFCDADVRDFDERFVVGLLAPLLLDPTVAFVKAYYERPRDGQPRGGGRVTELVARPALHLLFPELAGIVQPLSGEFAGRRALLESLPFVAGYGVDLGLLVDVHRAVGADAIAQVDLGTRVHRNRPLDQLGPMAAEVLHAALHRAGVAVPGDVTLHRPGARPAALRVDECPPLRSLPAPGQAR